MNFLADEGVDRQIVTRLRQGGHLVGYVAEMEPGLSDDIILDAANREKALLLTADKDFGELVFRQQRISSGVVLIRLAGLSPERKAEIVVAAIQRHLEKLTHAFSVITPAAFRIRRP